jgi:hypothetical protein
MSEPEMKEEIPAVDIRVESDGATPAEIAALTAVITGVIAELTAAESIHAFNPPTAWQRNQRPIRSSIAPGPGVWRNSGL